MARLRQPGIMKKNNSNDQLSVTLDFIDDIKKNQV